MKLTFRHSWLFVLLSLLAALVLAVGVACGGDDDDDGNGEEPTATEGNGDNGDEETPDEGDGDEETPSDGDGTEDILGEIEDAASEYENATGVVTYTFSDDTGDAGTWTVYTEGQNSRVDYDAGDGDPYISITTPEATYTCFGAGDEALCYEGEGGVGSNPFAGLFSSFASSEAIFGYLDAFGGAEIDTSSQDIAGIDANCYSASGDFTGEAGTVTWCFSDSGLLLLALYDFDTGGYEMRATEYSDTVPDDAFEPPYDVSTLGQ
jgi:hypothetical protein